MSLVDGEWFPSIVYLQNNVSPAQNKTNDRYTSLKPKGNQARNLAVPNCSSMEIYRSTIKNDNNSCKFNHPKSSTRYQK
jgi:hypothetical protein